MFLIDNQFPLLLAFFAAGTIGTAFIFRRPAGHRAWLAADLIWVVLGLFGALGAVVAGIYKADSSHIERQIDIAFAASTVFDNDSARFRLRYCETPANAEIAVLCDKVDFLAASTAENAELPLFIAVTREAAPLQGLRLLAAPEDDGQDMKEMIAKVDAFDPARFLSFAPFDDATRAAIGTLRTSRPGLAGDYQILAQSYDSLITEVARLRDEWQFLQSRSWILLIQIAAVCLVSFAAPFRLGKSIVELRDRR